MRRVVTGEQVAQIYNPDPFARPVFRAPVYQTPAGIILLAWLARFLFWLARLAFRHPVTTTTLALLAFLWFTITWIGLAAMAAWTVLVLVIWRYFWPCGFARWVATPARNARRAWVYRRRRPAPPQDQPRHGRQDLHRPAWRPLTPSPSLEQLVTAREYKDRKVVTHRDLKMREPPFGMARER